MSEKVEKVRKTRHRKLKNQSHIRTVPWSPENILIDTVARLQRDLVDIRAESRQVRTLGVLPVVPPLGSLHLRQLNYHGLQEHPPGSSTGRCLTL